MLLEATQGFAATPKEVVFKVSSFAVRSPVCGLPRCYWSQRNRWSGVRVQVKAGRGSLSKVGVRPSASLRKAATREFFTCKVHCVVFLGAVGKRTQSHFDYIRIVFSLYPSLSSPPLSLSLRVCVCIYSVYTYVHTYECVSAYRRVHTYVCISVCVRTCV